VYPALLRFLKDSLGERLIASKVFPETILSQYQLDSAKAEFLNLPFYRGLIATNAYLMAVRINKDVLASKERSIVIENISKLANAFGEKTNSTIHCLAKKPTVRFI